MLASRERAADDEQCQCTCLEYVVRLRWLAEDVGQNVWFALNYSSRADEFNLGVLVKELFGLPGRTRSLFHCHCSIVDSHRLAGVCKLYGEVKDADNVFSQKLYRLNET